MIKKGLIAIIFFVSITLPTVTHAQSNNEAEYRSYLLTLIELLQQQIILLQQQSNENGNGALLLEQGNKDEFDSFLIDDLDNIEAWYLIEDPSSVAGIKNSVHRRYFTRFFEIVPDEYDDYFVDLLVFEERNNEFDGFVETVAPYQGDTWRIGISEAMFEFNISSQMIEELYIHEFSHIISYEGIQGRSLPSNTRCHEFFSDLGCPPANSYLVDFVNEFWTEADLDALVETDDPESIWSNNELRNNFVTDYATTNPTEDFAESFTFFVLEDRAEGSDILDQKINYFYGFDHLLTLREEIRAEL